MNFGQSFRLALKSLMTSKMRALLTMLGIIIGVGAVIVITSLGNGMQNMMNEQFEKLGANLVQVQLFMYGGDSRSVDPDDMYELVDKYPQYISGVTPSVSAPLAVRQGSEDFERTSIYGVGETFLNERGATMSGQNLGKGRFISYIDAARYQNVCVIGAYLEEEAFQGDALGKQLSIGGEHFTVIGVLEKNSDMSEGSGDDIIYLPYTTALRLSGSADASMYMFTSTSKDTAATAKGIIENRLYKTFQSSDYYFVMTSAEMMDAMNAMMGTMMAVLVAIAAISLLVGGIGIMNIMLVSVTERTREIGIRKSLGAKRKDIRGQFIIEAGTTSAIGGVLGILVGIGLASLAGSLIGGMMTSSMGGGSTFSAVPNLSSVAVAFGVSVGIGILFGYLPAKKAAALNPIDALRYESGGETHMKIRRFCSGLLAAVLLLGLMVLPAGAAAASTVSTEEAIQVINALGIMVGDESGEFHLNRRVTRAEFITMAVNATGTGDQVGEASTSPYPDVPRTHWAAGYVQAGVQAGLSGWDLPPLQPDHPGGGRYHRPQAAGLHRRGLLWGLSHRPAGHVPQPKAGPGCHRPEVHRRADPAGYPVSVL